jgi:elongation factor G
MREYQSSEIRNVAVVGHGASGKTTLVDALAFAAGATRRHGSVRDGTALTDYSAEETERKHSVALGCACAEWMGSKLNFVDTPGFADFQGDAVAGLAAADGALVCVPATGEVEVGTERMFAEAVARQDPVLFVVTMLDREHASFDRAYESIKARLTPNVVPVEIPVGEGPANRGVINLFSRRAYLYPQGSRSGDYVETEVPERERERFERYHAELIEAISATDDALLERYLDGAEIGRDEAIAGMKEAMKRGDLYPVFCVSSETMVGVRALLTEIVQLMPSAYEMEELHVLRGSEGDRAVEIHAVDDAPFSALVFKTQSEPHVGDVSFFRIFSGTVSNGQELFNASRGVPEKAGHLSIALGKDRVEVPRLHPGDIGCVAKLRDTHTNDTLATREHPVRLPPVNFPEPTVTYAVSAAARADDEKLHAALQRLREEDPTITTRYEPETRETLVSGLGERHLEVAMARLRRKYGVRAEPREARRARRGLPLRRPGGGRRDPVQVRAGRRPRGAGGGAARRARRLPDGGLRGGAVRRLVPRGGLERAGVQDGRGARVQDGGAEVPPRAPRAARRGRGHHARGVPGRRARRPLGPPRPHPRHPPGRHRPRHHGARGGAAGGTAPVRHAAALAHARPRQRAAPVQGLRADAHRRGAAGDRGGGARADGGGVRGGSSGWRRGTSDEAPPGAEPFLRPPCLPC